MKLIKIIVLLLFSPMIIKLIIYNDIKKQIFVKSSNNNKEIKGCKNYSILLIYIYFIFIDLSSRKKIKKPKISIVIPAYNSEKLLGKCIESDLNQTLKEIEIIVIDDLSTDNTKFIIKKYHKKDSKVIGIFSKKNRGAGYSRNLGIEKASGEFVGFIDSDDFVDKEFYENLYLNSKDKDIVHGIRVVHNFKKFFSKSRKNPYGCIIPSIIRINFLKKNNIRFPTFKGKGEDSTFKAKLYKNKPRVALVRDNGIYYHYAKRGGSLSHYIKKE